MPWSRFSVPLSKLMRCRCLLKHLYLRIYISALQRQPRLLKTNSTQVTWLITLWLIICPSSYKARPDNLIGLIKFLIRHNFSPTEQCQTKLPDLKFCGRSSSDIQTTILHYCMYKSNNIHKCLFGPVTTFSNPVWLACCISVNWRRWMQAEFLIVKATSCVAGLRFLCCSYTMRQSTEWWLNPHPHTPASATTEESDPLGVFPLALLAVPSQAVQS